MSKSYTPGLKVLKDTNISKERLLPLKGNVHVKTNDIVIFESTVYPGATENVCIPILEKYSGLNYKINDFDVCYSPERINPGDKKHTIDKINKLIAIPNKKNEQKVKNVYKHLSKKIFVSNSIKETETSKVIENIQ